QAPRVRRNPGKGGSAGSDLTRLKLGFRTGLRRRAGRRKAGTPRGSRSGADLYTPLTLAPRASSKAFAQLAGGTPAERRPTRGRPPHARRGGPQQKRIADTPRPGSAPPGQLVFDPQQALRGPSRRRDGLLGHEHPKAPDAGVELIEGVELQVAV